MRSTRRTRFSWSNHGVTEIIGTMLLLIISISLFSVVYLSVFTMPEPTPTPSAHIVGTLDVTTDQIRFHHLGGSPLSGDNIIRVQKGSTIDEKVLSDYVGDEWTFGEVVFYDITNYQNAYIDALIIDVESNAIVSSAILQKGFSQLNPYVYTDLAKQIGKESATLNMDYDFVKESGVIYFSYREKGTPIWTNTSSIAKSGFGSYEYTLDTLEITTTYEFRGVLRHGSTVLLGSIVEFTTSSVPLETMVDDLPEVIDVTPYTITASGDSDLDNITLYYRYSSDGISWYGGDEDINWWNSSWTKRIRLSIDHHQVRGTLNNFTVFVKITNSSLADHAQLDGDDFVFIANDGTLLPHEIESYQSGTGTLSAWVKFPVLSHTENTTCWLYYSNPSCGNQEQVHETWDDSYVSVYHMDTMLDSTVQHNTLTDHDTNDVSGMVGNCRQFKGASSSYLHVSSSDFDLPNSFTVSCWYYSTTEQQQQYATLLNKQDSSDKHKDRNWWVSFTQGSEYTWFKASSVVNENYIQIDTNHKAVEDDEWHHVSISYDAISGVADIVLCGGKHSGRATSLGFSLEGQGDPFYIGRSVGDTNRNFKGFIDEVYVSNVQRDLNWTGTYYDMIINQSSFCSIIPSGGSGWTKWDNPSANPDESPPWSWDFPLAESEGFYEFISIGQYENNTELWPEDADQACEYDI